MNISCKSTIRDIVVKSKSNDLIELTKAIDVYVNELSKSKSIIELLIRDGIVEITENSLIIKVNGSIECNGIIANLLRCYSSTCCTFTGGICYSFLCCRIQNISLSDKLHVSILSSLSEKEYKRLSVVNELIETEKEYVYDLFIVKNLFKVKVMNSCYEDKNDFVKKIFCSNSLNQLIKLHKNLVKLLEAKEKNILVGSVYDCFMSVLEEMNVYVNYAIQYTYSKHYYANTFVHYHSFIERLEQTYSQSLRKLTLYSFLNKPLQRISRYTLLLQSILKHSNNNDTTYLPIVIEKFNSLLATINKQTGVTSNTLRLQLLSKQLLFTKNEYEELYLLDKQRQFIREGSVKLKTFTESIDCHCFLLDHVFIVTKKKKNNFKVIRKIIPLDLLEITSQDLMSIETKLKYTSFLHRQKSSTQVHNHGFNIYHLSIDTSYTLICSNYSEKKQWIEHILHQKLLKQTLVFKISLLNSFTFNVTCLTFVKDNEYYLATDTCIYYNCYDSNSGSTASTKALELDKIVQIVALPQHNLFLVLADRLLYSCELDALLTNPKPHRISSHVSFFQYGVINNVPLICIVKSSSLSTYIKLYEPIATQSPKSRFKKLFSKSTHSLSFYKELYIPSESTFVAFFKSTLVVGCLRGFEIVSLDSLETQGLLDASDSSLDFVLRRESVRPIAIFRMESFMNGDYMLCYNEFGFFVDKTGKRTNIDRMMVWECRNPQSFAFIDPYILVFGESFVEVRDVRTGKFMQAIACSGLHLVEERGLWCVMGEKGSIELFRLVKVEYDSDIKFVKVCEVPERIESVLIESLTMDAASHSEEAIQGDVSTTKEIKKLKVVELWK